MDDHPWDKYISAYKLPIALGFVGLILLIGGLFSSGILSRTFIKSTKYPEKSLVKGVETSPAIVKVDVSGAVINPGVYSLVPGSRMEEAIRAAGGVTEKADPVFITKSLNLAQKISDGMKVYIPEVGETNIPSLPMVKEAGNSGVVSQSNGLINLNSSSIGELESLPGVGPVTAQKIIDNRPYGGIEELLIKKAVTRSVYEKIKEKVSVY